MWIAAMLLYVFSDAPADTGLRRLPFETHQLANGLTVILHEDHSTPIVTVNVVYRVGSRDESPHRTGFAHLFEHFMFEGSPNAPGNTFDRLLQEAGGENNAYTTLDYTSYFETLPAHQLELALFLEADRMRMLDFSEENLANQRAVVQEEYRQSYLNRPYGQAYLRILPLAFRVHPYRWPTIGATLEHIAQATLEEVKEFFFRYYRPNNAALIIAGDIDPKQVKELVARYFGDIPRGPELVRSYPEEPPQEEERIETFYDPASPLPAVLYAYKIPGVAHPDYPALEFLTEALAGGKSSRLYQRLVYEKQLALNVGAYTLETVDPGLLILQVVAAPGKQLEDVLPALEEELERLRRDGVTAEELEKIRNRYETQLYQGRQTTRGKADELARAWAQLGDPEAVNSRPMDYLRLRPEDLQRAAQRYLVPQRRSVLHYLPGSDKAGE
ncbi:MAG: pitrilysin family protein [Bacteroidota bacterium]|nr:insulinase family protein [Rhodothermia bacterium]MDW8285078.1 pitrilysin family protein [Bacteroidota bacterium]